MQNVMQALYLTRNARGLPASARRYSRLKRDNPNIEKSIFNSIHTVALDTFPGYKTKGEVHSFLEHYDQ